MKPKSYFIRRSLSTFAVMGIGGLPGGHALAADLTWDPANSGSGGSVGAGTWDLDGTNSTWFGVSDVPWTNGNTATFAGATDAGGTIDVNAGLSVTGLTFNKSGYTLSADEARIITNTGDITVASGKSATIGNNVTVTNTSADFNVNGADATASGTLNIATSGFLTTTSKKLQIIGSGAIVNVSGTIKTTGSLTGGAILIGGTSGTSTVNVEVGGALESVGGGIRIGANTGVGELNMNGGSVTGSSTTLMYVGYGSGSNGFLTINSGGLVDMAAATFNMGQLGASTSNGTINLNGGTLLVKKVNFGASAVNVIKLNGGVIKAAEASTSFFGGGGVAGSGLHVHDGGAAFNSNNFDITVSGNLKHSTLSGVNAVDGGLTKTANGKLTLSGANTYTGVTTISGGTLSVASIGDGGVVSGNLGSATNAAANIVFDGGTLQYTGSNATSDRAFTINPNRTATIESANSIELVGATGAGTNGALTKTGAGVLTLAGTNTYTGATTVSAGTLLIGISGSLANTAVTVGGATASGTPSLGGGGTIAGATMFAAASGGVVGTHAPGVKGVTSGVGTQTFSNSLTYASGSIFEWDLVANKDTDGYDDDSDIETDNTNVGTRGTDFDAVNVSGTLTVDSDDVSGAIFRVVLGSGVGTDGTFWQQNQTWNNIFGGGFSLSGTGFNNSLLQVVDNAGMAYDQSALNAGYGFSVSGTTLTWSAVPEPSSALAGLLLGAGLSRRRRGA